MKKLVITSILLLPVFIFSCSRAKEIEKEKTEVEEIEFEKPKPISRISVEVPDFQDQSHVSAFHRR